MNSTYFPHFTIGSDAYDKIPDICGEYGKTAVIIGGTKARIAAEPLIRKAVSGKIDITGSFLYGDDATFENAEALTKPAKAVHGPAEKEGHTVTLKIRGMMCGHCEAAVRKALEIGRAHV